MERQLDDRIETYTELIDGQCKCGKPVLQAVRCLQINVPTKNDSSLN